MTTVQRIAQVSGWLFVVMAIWGAAVTGTSMDADLATADRLWGLFPINFLHNLVHLAIGFWGITAARSRTGARAYAVAAGALYIVLAVLGLFFPDGLGLVPLGGADIWLHAGLGVLLLVPGLALGSATDAPSVEPAPTRTVMPPSTTASSAEGTVTKPPAEPRLTAEGGDRPVEPKPPENVVDEPPQQPDRPADRPDDGEPPRRSGR